MPVQPPCSPHGWTLDTLEKHLTEQINFLRILVEEHDERNKERFAASKESVVSALAAADKALIKAELSSEKRFEGVNEFRATLADQAANLMPRSEYTVQHRALEEKVNILTSQYSNIQG